MSYIIYFVLIMIIPIWAQFRVKGAYKKYSNVASSSQMKGAEVARKILDSNGLYHVNIEEVKGYCPIIMIQEPKRSDFHLEISMETQ